MIQVLCQTRNGPKAEIRKRFAREVQGCNGPSVQIEHSKLLVVGFSYNEGMTRAKSEDKLRRVQEREGLILWVVMSVRERECSVSCG